MLKTFWLLLALFFVVALNMQLSNWLIPGYSIYDIKRILEIILLLGTSCYLLASTANRKLWLALYQQLPYLAKLLILGIFALGLASALFAPLLNMALLEVSLFFLLFTLSLFIAAQRATIGNSIDKILLGIVLLGLVVYEITWLYTHTNYVGFINRRFLNQYLIWVLPLVTLPLTFNVKKYLKIIIYVIAICAWIIAFADFAKGMLLSLLIAYIVIFFSFKQQAKTWLLTQIKLVGISIIITLIGYFFLAGLSLPHYFLDSFIHRLYLWRQAIHLLLSHPLLGVGPMHFSYYLNPIAAHPHNSLLLIACEWGLPVTLMVLFLFSWGLYSWLTACRKKPQPTTIALTTAFIAGSCYSLVSGVIITPLSQIMLCIVVGWMLGIYYVTKKPAAKITILTQIVCIFLLLFAILGLLLGTIPAVFYLPNMEYQWLYQHQIHIFNPRFWLQGWIK